MAASIHSTAAGRLRATATGPDSVTVQFDALEAQHVAPPASGERVEPIPASSDDRALGRRRYEVVVEGWRFEVTVEPAATAALRERAARAAAEHHPATGVTLRAQIPGRIVRVWVTDGERVEQGQRLLAVEAMKMENEIRAPRGGTVVGVRVEVGRLVERNDELMSIS